MARVVERRYETRVARNPGCANCQRTGNCRRRQRRRRGSSGPPPSWCGPAPSCFALSPTYHICHRPLTRTSSSRTYHLLLKSAALKSRASMCRWARLAAAKRGPAAVLFRTCGALPRCAHLTASVPTLPQSPNAASKQRGTRSPTARLPPVYGLQHRSWSCASRRSRASEARAPRRATRRAAAFAHVGGMVVRAAAAGGRPALSSAEHSRSGHKCERLEGGDLLSHGI